MNSRFVLLSFLLLAPFAFCNIQLEEVVERWRYTVARRFLAASVAPSILATHAARRPIQLRPYPTVNERAVNEAFAEEMRRSTEYMPFDSVRNYAADLNRKRNLNVTAEWLMAFDVLKREFGRRNSKWKKYDFKGNPKLKNYIDMALASATEASKSPGFDIGCQLTLTDFSTGEIVEELRNRGWKGSAK